VCGFSLEEVGEGCAVTYMGNKSKVIGGYLSVMQADIDRARYVVDVFVGGGNVISRIKHSRRFAFDVKPLLIACYREYGGREESWFEGRSEFDVACPKSGEDFRQLLLDPGLSDGYRGFLCFCGGFNGSYGTFVYNEARWGSNMRMFKREIGALGGIVFRCCSYDKIPVVRFGRGGCYIMDPPYSNRYSYGEHFDSTAFWRWAEWVAGLGNVVYVMELYMPSPFVCVAEKEHEYNVHLWQPHERVTEKLFRLGGL